MAQAKSLVAIGLDGPNNALFETWLGDGTLPNLQRLMTSGVSGRLRHEKRFRNELCWNILLTGQEPRGSGAVFSPTTYAYRNLGQSELEASPFYVLDSDYRVCVFDLVAPLVPDLNGLQVIGWGSELNSSTPVSQPAGLMDDRVARHGPDPKTETAYRVHGEVATVNERGFRNPNIYMPADLTRYIDYLSLAIQRRTAIALDLLDRGPWHLFLGVFAETHTANHLFWHLSQDYPVPSPLKGVVDPLRDVFKKVDTSIGSLVSHLPDDCALMV